MAVTSMLSHSRIDARKFAQRGKTNTLLVVLCALTLAACNQNGEGSLSAAQPRGATVAFDTIDGPPPGQFRALVKDLNDEAQARNLAVLPHESPSAYRVRGYLAAEVRQGRTTISWVWDVFDRNEQRAFRINGSESVNSSPRDAWLVADEAMLQRIARTSMEQLAAFLTSPEAAPGTPSPSREPQISSLKSPGHTPETADISLAYADSATAPDATLVSANKLQAKLQALPAASH